MATFTSIIESIGDYFAAAQLCNIPRPPHHAVSRGILVEGIAGILSGFMGASHATTSYSGHVALIGITKVNIKINKSFSLNQDAFILTMLMLTASSEISLFPN